jgi:hypothetical protein
MKKLQKFTDEHIKYGHALRMSSHDTLNWSQPDKSFRVRFDRTKLTVHPLLADYSLNNFNRLFESKTKAKKMHGYLEGDYKLATSGFYTNNLNGIKKIIDRYPNLVEKVQTYEQYKFSQMLARELVNDE